MDFYLDLSSFTGNLPNSEVVGCTIGDQCTPISMKLIFIYFNFEDKE